MSRQGERTAEQALMAVVSVYGAVAANEHPAHEKEARAAFDRLFRQLDNPSAYDPERFEAGFREIERLLP
jgi:hypothetical protein